jgi:hypothetical protein
MVTMRRIVSDACLTSEPDGWGVKDLHDLEQKSKLGQDVRFWIPVQQGGSPL